MSKAEPLDELSKYIKKNFKSTLKEIAININLELEWAYERAIGAFYDDYTPIYYERTGSSYLASTFGMLGGKPAYTDQKGALNPISVGENGYLSGIYINSNIIPTQIIKDGLGKESIVGPYKADTDWVFQRTFIKGIHGITDAEMRDWGNRAHQKSDWWYKIARDSMLDSYFKTHDAFTEETYNAFSKASFGQYKKYRKWPSYLRARPSEVGLNLKVNTQLQMSEAVGTPYQIMNKFYNEYTRSSNIERMVDEAFIKKFLGIKI